MKERQALLDKIVKEYEDKRRYTTSYYDELGAPLSLSNVSIIKWD
ncbi:hypothetical protein ACVXZZ_02880 [Staphylococcus aureus]